MKVVSYVLDGELEHKDSMGNGEVLRTGEFPRTTAGKGITHVLPCPAALGDPSSFLNQNCVHCHDADNQPGSLNLEADRKVFAESRMTVESRCGHAPMDTAQHELCDRSKANRRRIVRHVVVSRERFERLSADGCAPYKSPWREPK